MVSTVTVSGTSSIDVVALSAAVLAFVVAVVVLQVVVASDGRTTSARGFLLGGSASLGGLRFHFGC